MSELVDVIKTSENINENQRKCILEYYVNNHKLEEVSNMIGVTVQCVRYYIKTGLNKIRYEAGYANV